MKQIAFDEHVKIFLTDKADGNMKNPKLDRWVTPSINENRLTLFSAAGLTEEDIALIKVDYSRDDFAVYRWIEEKSDALVDIQVQNLVPSDGLATRCSGVGIFLPLADCMGAVIYDTKENILMVVHSGRHNLEQEGLSKAVQFLQRFGSRSENLIVWLSPSAGRGNYPVLSMGNRSLEEIGRAQLMEAGVTEIFSENIDTTMDERYFSHSSGDTEARFAILAILADVIK
ncbi:MAG: laccase domain-containing protein [Clostridiales Family XIII bacterium]|jgi:hypothetical protein|nr:laccase domain-containing protein [Clostridiales Family XIII bacterium]